VTSLTVHVIGVGLWGPGLEGWAAGRKVLAGEVAWEERPSPAPPPAILPATERRRTGPVVRLALTVAQEAAESSGLAPAGLRSVFASGNGDGVVVSGILEGLAAAGQQPRAVSPTQFHNSVHNAAAGYWSIAHGSARPATCVGLHDNSFVAGLLKAVVEVVAEDEPVLLCAYDHPVPPPLDAKRSTIAPFGAGLVLAPDGMGQPLARLALCHAAHPPTRPAEPRNPALRPLMAGNPAARALPLLEAMALSKETRLELPYLDGSLTVTVTP
jgi:Beta-ketoacyl synthase, N-terminal domain